MEPTQDEWAQARELLNKSARPALLGQIGGARPEDKADRFRSWWGGNFLASPNEAVPVCAKSGRAMHPVLQVRVDETANVTQALNNVALLNLWLDLETREWWNAENGVGFCIRSYSSFAELNPVGPGYREHPTFPVFPVTWRAVAADLPAWEDFAGKVSDAVARSPESEWFFCHPARDQLQAMQKDRPIKIGGCPQWIQGSQWPQDSEFVLQLDSTAKGALNFAGGSAYIFMKGGRWLMKGDTY